ncbi:MAG TPA: M23 family metallopeptidase [Bacteroidota bacterium]|nr:M23 family metallopeptidase [Bacteroidota bacterium]
MPSQNPPERRKNRRYTVILVPEGETRKSRTVSFSSIGLLAVVAGSILVIMSIVVAAVIYTPIGSRLPIHSAEVEQRYGRQIVGIQEQLRSLVQEMSVLRAYNVQLRRALGETVDTTEINAARNARRDSVIRADEDVMRREAGEEGPERNEQVQAILPEGTNPVQTLQARTKVEQVEFPLLQPVEGFVSRGFDPTQFHYGIDFAGKPGSVVLAAADGNVVFAGWTYDDGYMLIIGHELGFMTMYKHNKSLLKTTGTFVKRGEAIALLGNTGRTSSGPHLHFEVWKDGIARDPGDYLLTIQ